MLNLRIVNNVQQAWSDVEPLLAKAMPHVGGEYNLEQLKVLLVEGKQKLLVLVDEHNEIKTAFTVSFIDYPNDRIAFLTAIGGRTDLNAFNQFKDWSKLNGCTKIQGATFQSVARLWKSKLGFTEKYTIMEFSI